MSVLTSKGKVEEKDTMDVCGPCLDITQGTPINTTKTHTDLVGR